jgi:hypothetical protein
MLIVQVEEEFQEMLERIRKIAFNIPIKKHRDQDEVVTRGRSLSRFILLIDSDRMSIIKTFTERRYQEGG